MKNRPAFLRLLFLSSFAGLLQSSCHDTTAPQATATCRIQQFSTPADNTTYTYNAQGRPLKWVYTLGTNDLTITATYTYDGDGYLTSSSLVRNDNSFIKIGQPARQTTTSITYSYTNGRLSSYLSQKSPGSSPGVKITGTFQYDATGALLTENARLNYTSDPQQSAEPYQFADGLQQTWFYTNNQLVDYATKSGEVEKHPYTIVNGLVTKVEGISTFEYDNQRHLIKSTVYNQEALNSYFTTEWDTGKSWRESLPAFKGFPPIVPVAGQGIETRLGADLGALDSGVYGPTGIPKSYAYFATYNTSGIVQLTKSTFTNQVNSQGYVVSTTTMNATIYPAESQQSTTRTTGYTYTGCN